MPDAYKHLFVLAVNHHSEERKKLPKTPALAMAAAVMPLLLFCLVRNRSLIVEIIKRIRMQRGKNHLYWERKFWSLDTIVMTDNIFEVLIHFVQIIRNSIGPH